MGQRGSKGTNNNGKRGSTRSTTTTTTNTTNTVASIQNDPQDFEKGIEFIIDKLKNNEIYRARLQDINIMRQFAEVLGTEDKLQTTYLTTKWLDTVDLARKMLQQSKTLVEDEELSRSGHSGMKSVVPASTAASDVNQINKTPSENVGGDFDDDDDIINEEDIRLGEKDPGLNKILEQNTVKVKIVISEIAKTKGKKAFRRMLSPVLSKLDMLPELGMFHSALQIGPWLIEWNNSAICVPRKCVSSAAMLSADIEQLQTNEDVRNVVEKLSKVIVKWNTSMSYKERDTEPGKSGNCQDFVDDVLVSIGLSRDSLSQGPLGEFLKKLKTKGQSDLVFKMNEQFRKAFNFAENKKKFTTHRDLDEFVKGLLTIDPDFEKNYRYEWLFLKSMDRAFWLKHIKFEEMEEYKPASREAVDEDDEVILITDCPFKDPRDTYSFIYDDE
ncbi:predicted protein [Naegleria gruberi]|uniref:Predicted protein n=1 Tax=Naegleria gruberi TaxID=5762 RepID=D2VHZ8_NAEGR|nr:uncharacterized protein NAEGRDRAFT_68503 [Naegleria gruberi]EFC43428.1 predicted protein [Naegleria gruberi]|eukprot:XP_002676172.1 predicted protein [Naegleria gruberi strain NEG-M]